MVDQFKDKERGIMAERVQRAECPVCHQHFSGPGAQKKAKQCAKKKSPKFKYAVGQKVDKLTIVDRRIWHYGGRHVPQYYVKSFYGWADWRAERTVSLYA